MCGIAGIICFGSRVERLVPALTRMSYAMRRRGPDDEGYVVGMPDGSVRDCIGPSTPRGVHPDFVQIEDLANEPLSFGLAHRRLSIIDLSAAGHQPMADPSGRYRITYNGELYNFREIRRDIGDSESSYRSAGDTETILRAYLKWGPGCVERFNGDFAFVILDTRDRSLFCARDHVGIKPFYYSHDQERFLFGSDMKTLMASGFTSHRPDPAGLASAMTFGIAPRPLTAFEGIRALEAGCWMHVTSDGRIREHRYWEIPTNRRDHTMSPSEAVEMSRGAIETAVQRRLLADVPVATFLSGGVDSGIVTAMASRHVNGILGYTLSFDVEASRFDEVAEAEATAAMHPITHRIERIRPEDCLDDVMEWIDGYEEPYYEIASNHVIASCVHRDGVKVALNGLGGDENFAGYNYYSMAKKWRRTRPLAPLARIFRNLGGRRGQRIAEILKASSSDRFHSAMHRSLFDADIHRLFTRDFIGTAPIDIVESTFEAYARDREFADDFDAIRFMDLKNYVGNHHVTRVDQFLMLKSVEGRFPLLDIEVLEAAARIPPEIALREGESKWILKQIGDGLIANSAIRMKKKGFGLPLGAWMRGPLGALVDESIESLKRRPFINSDTVESMRRRQLHGRLPHQSTWHLVSLELWLQRFVDRPPEDTFGTP